MPSPQTIEHKSSCHDDYPKWIYSFANAQGGRIYIGKNNAGKVAGLEDYDELSIPKFRWKILNKKIQIMKLNCKPILRKAKSWL